MLTSLTAADLAATDRLGALDRQRWLSVVTHLDPRFGGLSAVVPQLAAEIASQERVTMQIAAFCSPGELYSTNSRAEPVISEWPASRLKWLRDKSLTRRFETMVSDMEGIHLHGLWEQSTEVAARAARRCGIPYVVSAHGMLERWALQQKALKKTVYAALIGRPILAQAACVHALTLAEAADYRRFRCTVPIVVIPNGVRIPQQVTASLFLQKYPSLEGKRIVLFLGRIHAKKGLDVLVRAWRDVAREHPDSVLVLAGPDSEGTSARVLARVESEGLLDRVVFTGMLRGEIKWSALAAAECFVLPSFSEGLSVSVLEAMGMGLPVIISPECNLPEVEARGAGWVVPAEEASLARGLLHVLDQSPEENRAAGARGAVFVREHYNWRVVAQQMADVYRWVTMSGEPPATLYREGMSSQEGTN